MWKLKHFEASLKKTRIFCKNWSILKHLEKKLGYFVKIEAFLSILKKKLKHSDPCTVNQFINNFIDLKIQWVVNQFIAQINHSIVHSMEGIFFSIGLSYPRNFIDSFLCIPTNPYLTNTALGIRWKHTHT